MKLVKSNICRILVGLFLLFSLVPHVTVTASTVEQINPKETKTATYEHMTNNKIDGIVFESISGDINKEYFQDKIEKKELNDLTIQIELKDKFYNSDKYAELQNSRNNYADQYEFLRILRDECNDFYRNSITSLNKGLSFSRNEYYSCFFDITDIISRAKEPYQKIQDYVGIPQIENVIVSKKHVNESDGLLGTFYGETIETINGSEHINSNNRTYTGQGIKVGVSEVEMSGVDIDCSNHSNFTLDPRLGTGSSNCAEHPHFVLSAITSMAPNVQIYGSDSSNEGINWLIQQNVSVINCSWGSESCLGQYCSREKYYDTLALDNQMIFVFSAGNADATTNPNNRLTCPKSAYNVITVGATDSNGTTIADYSCYRTDVDIGKPNLVANGSPHLLGSGVSNPFHAHSGTSYAAPLVTGALALLQDKGPGFSVESAHALLAVSANLDIISNAGNLNNGGFNSKAGAGMLDVDRLLDLLSLNDEQFYVYEGTPLNNNVKEFQIWMSEGLTVKVGAFWFAKPQPNRTLPEITDYDLKIYNSAGSVVAISNSSGSNAELIEFTATVAGDYKIQLHAFSNSIEGGNDRGTIAFSYEI